ncbi:MAG: hypothetical protein V7L01_12320 [Nostoc sp.]|uniref:hypothetical protein n=1 Tax=Nostoc sp. TaxID=1180 RepID=UPI002FFB493D
MNYHLYELPLACFGVGLHVYTQLRSSANSLVQVVEIHQGNFEGIVTELREIKSEIRGLRTESQSILKHLFGRQENDK